MEELSDEDSEIAGDLELDPEEQRMLEMAEIEDIEDLAQQETKKMSGKKRKSKVNVAFEQEMEYENQPAKSQEKIKMKSKRPKSSA